MTSHSVTDTHKTKIHKLFRREAVSGTTDGGWGGLGTLRCYGTRRPVVRYIDINLLDKAGASTFNAEVNKIKKCRIPDFRRDVDEICDVLGY
jgi:hypothetical protein